ncbi:MAG TPA: hypothetical protein PLH92_15240 [Mycobacterium sp.]|nr:hypothetical protein [Mycobacterium sp.]
METESQRPGLDWQKTAEGWHAHIPAHVIGPRDIPVSEVTYRVELRESPTRYLLRIFHAGSEDSDRLPEEFRTFRSLDEATDLAESLSNHYGPYDGFVDGFFVQWRSNVDGDRFLIIDERDYDMTGWSIIVRDGIRAFGRNDGWYSYGGRFYHDGYGNAELRYPWTALCDHGEEVVRFLPPHESGKG